MPTETALLTFSIGPVHTFIAQARRVADLWAGSVLLSHLVNRAIESVRESGGTMVFPYVTPGERPEGLPNRFVCRIPLQDADRIVCNIEDAVRREWNGLVATTVEILASAGIDVAPAIWQRTADRRRQTDDVLSIAWSWVPETGGYKSSSDRGARQFAASRLFRPFQQISEAGEKCPLCGDRTALPDGERDNVHDLWAAAEARTAEGPLSRYFRRDQSRLCLVCATKRLFPHIMNRGTRFDAFERFQPKDERPYFAVVAMDGDRMGEILRGDASHDDHALERFHREVSTKLTDFANRLRSPDSTDLNLASLRFKSVGAAKPQLIYAGGEDVLFVADPRDAITAAVAVRNLYRDIFAGNPRFTISAAVLFAHTKHPAGLLFNDAESLLKQKAKREAGRDAIAIRLDKRSGATTDIAFRWDAAPAEGVRAWTDLFTNASDGIVALVGSERVSSVKTYQLAHDARTLAPVLESNDDWSAWIAESLSKSGSPPAQAEVDAIRPFLQHGMAPALRIARFLGREIGAAS